MWARHESGITAAQHNERDNGNNVYAVWPFTYEHFKNSSTRKPFRILLHRRDKPLTSKYLLHTSTNTSMWYNKNNKYSLRMGDGESDDTEERMYWWHWILCAEEMIPSFCLDATKLLFNTLINCLIFLVYHLYQPSTALLYTRAPAVTTVLQLFLSVESLLLSALWCRILKTLVGLNRPFDFLSSFRPSFWNSEERCHSRER